MSVSRAKPQEFYVWVPPDNYLVQHNLGHVGSFSGGPAMPGEDRPEHLLFVPNSRRPLKSVLTPFHLNIVWNYQVEYFLEVVRSDHYPDLPSRLYALFLLPSLEEAEVYRRTHTEHVIGRVLKRGEPAGEHRFSLHDAAWIDYLREAHELDEPGFNRYAHAYWSGERADRHALRCRGKVWHCRSVIEVLFYGRISFPDRTLADPEEDIQIPLEPTLAKALDRYAERHCAPGTARGEALLRHLSEWAQEAERD